MWALVAAMLLCACTRAEGPTTTKKRVVIGTTVEPDALQPLLTTSAGAMEVATLWSRGLSAFDPSWRVVADRAAEVPALGGGATLQEDGALVVRWRIRDDAAWEDGAPLVADDFVFAWKRALDPAEEALEKDVASRTALKAIAPKLLEVRWAKPYPTFFEPRVHEVLPAHATGPPPLAKDPRARRPLSNGPFRLVEHAPGRHMILARNERFAPRPLLDEIVVRFAGSTAGLAAMMEAGEVDVAPQTGGVTAAEAERLVATGRFDVVAAPSGAWAHVDMNLDDRVLRDARVRRALAAAIDRPQAVAGVFGPSYVVAESFLPPAHPLHAPVVAQPHDPALAERLLDEAGWRRPAPGAVRVDASGAPLSLVLSSASGQTEAERFLLVLQSQWRKVGVDVVLDLKPFPAFFSTAVKKRAFPHLAFYAWTMGPTTDGDSMWRADRIPSAENGWEGRNVPGWRDAEVTALLEASQREMDPAKRRALLARVQQRFVEELPAIPMYFKPAIAVVRKGVVGVRPTGTTTPTTWNAEAWDTTSALAR